jgi:hypothetical protein
MPPRPRPQDPRLRRPPPHPLGWDRPAPRAPGSGGLHITRAWWIAIVLVVTLAAGVWYFALRPSAPSSAFVRAFERYSAAVDEIRADAGEVSRFLELPEFEDAASVHILEMYETAKIFRRLARAEDGEAKRIARDAVDAVGRGSFAAIWYSKAIITRRLTSANRANGELGASVADLRLLAEQWKQLSAA